MKTRNQKIGGYCKQFRIDILKLGLKELAILNDDNDKNLWAFENGLANNIRYLFYYYNQIDNDDDKTKFSKGLFNLL